MPLNRLTLLIGPSRRSLSVQPSNIFSFMKKNRLVLVSLLCMSGFASTFMLSCGKEVNEPLAGKNKSNLPVTERGPCGSNFCDFTITTDANATLEICGNLEFSVGTCNFGCNPSTDVSITVNSVANTPFSICVLSNEGTVSIRISPTAPAVGITVQFGGSTPIITTIPAGGSVQFNTDATCTLTDAGCS
jgi:hypothetical protein